LIVYNPDLINNGIVHTLALAINPLLIRFASLANNENLPLQSEENQYEIVLKGYQDIKENHTHQILEYEKGVPKIDQICIFYLQEC
jgi:hypothetical protein